MKLTRNKGNFKDRSIGGNMRIFLLFTIIIIVFEGCTAIPSYKIDKIYGTGDLLHIFTSDGIIRSFYANDTNSLKVKTKKKFPNMQYRRQYYKPRVGNIVQDEDRLIIQASPRGGCSRVYISDLNMNMKEILNSQGDSANQPLLVGADNHYYYFRKATFDYSKGFDDATGFYCGFRISKNSMEQIEKHFDVEAFNEFTAAAVFDDEELYWYVCFYDSEKIKGVGWLMPGRLVIVSASKDLKAYKFFQYGSKITSTSMYFVNTSNSIWLFLESGKQVIKFSKENGEYEVFNTQTKMIPFPCQKEEKESRYLWAMSPHFGDRTTYRRERDTKKIGPVPRNTNLYRIDKNNFEIVITPLIIPEEIMIPSFGKEIYSDDEYLWINAIIYKRTGAPSGRTTAYLLRIDKASLSSEPLFIQPTLGEAASTVVYNFFAVLTFPLWAHPF